MSVVVLAGCCVTVAVWVQVVLYLCVPCRAHDFSSPCCSSYLVLQGACGTGPRVAQDMTRVSSLSRTNREAAEHASKYQNLNILRAADWSDIFISPIPQLGDASDLQLLFGATTGQRGTPPADHTYKKLL